MSKWVKSFLKKLKAKTGSAQIFWPRIFACAWIKNILGKLIAPKWNPSKSVGISSILIGVGFELKGSYYPAHSFSLYGSLLPRWEKNVNHFFRKFLRFEVVFWSSSCTACNRGKRPDPDIVVFFFLSNSQNAGGKKTNCPANLVPNDRIWFLLADLLFNLQIKVLQSSAFKLKISRIALYRLENLEICKELQKS